MKTIDKEYSVVCRELEQTLLNNPEWCRQMLMSLGKSLIDCGKIIGERNATIARLREAGEEVADFLFDLGAVSHWRKLVNILDHPSPAKGKTLCDE